MLKVSLFLCRLSQVPTFRFRLCCRYKADKWLACCGRVSKREEKPRCVDLISYLRNQHAQRNRSLRYRHLRSRFPGHIKLDRVCELRKHKPQGGCGHHRYKRESLLQEVFDFDQATTCIRCLETCQPTRRNIRDEQESIYWFGAIGPLLFRGRNFSGVYRLGPGWRRRIFRQPWQPQFLRPTRAIEFLPQFARNRCSRAKSPDGKHRSAVHRFLQSKSLSPGACGRFGGWFTRGHALRGNRSCRGGRYHGRWYRADGCGSHWASALPGLEVSQAASSPCGRIRGLRRTG